jgi:hypothetical protein
MKTQGVNGEFAGIIDESTAADKPTGDIPDSDSHGRYPLDESGVSPKGA